MRVGTRRSPAVTKATTTPTTEPACVPHELTFRRRGPRCLRYLLPAALWATACAVPPSKPVPQAPPPAPALHRGPPADFLSAAGLRWLVLVKPQQVLAEPELARAIQQIVPSARFQAFAESSGVDLHAVPQAAIAGWAYSTLYVAELPRGVAPLARARFSERLLSGALTKHAHPGIYRITGVIGQTPETLVTVDERLLAVAVGDPVQAKIVEAYAEQRLKSSPTALRGAALSSLPDLSASNVAVLYAPGPFANEWQHAANGLLESTVALAIAVQPIGNGKVATTICLAGEWQAASDDAANRLAAAWTAFARSSAGHLFELNETAEVRATPELLTLHVELDLAAIVRGLKASVLGDLSEILRSPSRTESTPNGPESSQLTR
jgi:hypothetical protein